MQNSLFIKKITPIDPAKPPKSPQNHHLNEDFLILPEETSSQTFAPEKISRQILDYWLARSRISLKEKKTPK